MRTRFLMTQSSSGTSLTLEKDGIDVRDVNKLARDFFNTFHYHMPHPKMDAVVESLATSWLTGRKTLVFVRRVASVTELEQKLNECYDAWLIPHMLHHLPEAVRDRFNRVVDDYRQRETGSAGPASVQARRCVSGARC